MPDPTRPPGRLAAGIARMRVTRYEHRPNETPTLREDWVVVEEPLQIRLADEPLVVTMRTPGYDHELAAGYLLSEGLIRSQADLGSIRHCDSGDEHNVLDVLPAPGSVLETDGVAVPRRPATSACGLCGREQIDDLLAKVAPITAGAAWPQRLLAGATAQLAQQQENHARTGGSHAAGIMDTTGAFRCVREDVGRHNAVDKVIGRMLLDGLVPLSGCALVVSGRVSFEIVQKAAMARLELVIGVSAPSSLAIATAERLGIALVGFARTEGFNVYAGAQRVTAEPRG